MENTFVFDRITAEDKDVFIDMSREFYASDAILAPVPEKFHTKAFEELMKGDRYLVGFIVRYGQKAAGYVLLAKSYSREAGGEMLWLDEIYLKGEYRGMGAAKKFFAFMHERFSPLVSGWRWKATTNGRLRCTKKTATKCCRTCR